MASGPTIDYEALQQDALRGIVRAALQQIAKAGLPGEHHFYISFLTQASGVVLSKRLKEKYPHEMTIVLQHRFWDLIVSDDRFEVKLTFDGVPERLVVPLTAIKVFIDPSVHFGLQFEDPADKQSSQSASRRSMTIDAAYDSAGGEARPDTPRATLSKKPRPARKPRAEKDSAGAAQVHRTATSTNEPAAPQPPQPEPASAGATPAPAAQPAATGEDAGEKSGAKVVSLDAFRKK